MTTNEKGNYTGKVAFVTGAASGIGRAAALANASEGARVVAADVSEHVFVVGHAMVIDGG